MPKNSDQHNDQHNDFLDLGMAEGVFTLSLGFHEQRANSVAWRMQQYIKSLLASFHYPAQALNFD